MSIHQYTIDADGTFLNKKVDIPRLISELQTGLPNVTLSNIQILDGNCVMTFIETLSYEQIVALETLVFAHTGESSSLSNSGFTTTSTSYTVVPSLATTLLAGKYHIRFSGSGFPQSNNRTQTMAIFKAGSLIAGSERSIKSGGAQTAGMVIGFDCEVTVAVGAMELIEARIKSGTSGVAVELFNCNLSAVAI
jgi:hypothetical protein